MEGIVESAVFSHKFGNPEISVHNVVVSGTQYQCFQPTILNKIGQKITFAKQLQILAFRTILLMVMSILIN